jgi:adenylate cyclase
VWQAGGSVADTGFDELKELCLASGDRAALATGMAGLVMALAGHERLREASQQASELIALIDEIGDSARAVGLLAAAAYAKSEVGEMTEALRLAQRIIDLAAGEPRTSHTVMGLPLERATSMRGLARMCLGIPGWQTDLSEAVRIAATVDRASYVGAILYKYVVAVPVGALPADAVALRETAEALRIAERSGDDHTLALAQLTRGLVCVHHARREEGFSLLSQAREAALKKGFTLNALAVVDPEIARERARNGDLDGAVKLARAAVDDMFARGAMFLRGAATTVLVEALLDSGADGNLREAQAAIDRLAAVPTDPGFVLHELPLLRLRALVARAQGDESGCREFLQRYCAMAGAAGFGPLAEAVEGGA